MIAVVLVLGIWGVATWVDSRGKLFFESGKDIVATLDQLAAALTAGREQDLSRLFAANFAGTRLGLLTRDQIEEKDGAHVYRQKSDGASLDRGGAVAEWMGYRAGFSKIVEAGLHLDRLEEWGGTDLIATVRLEVIGTPQGGTQAGIDRALFRMTFAQTADGLEIRHAAFVSGERIISDRPQFEDVAHTAGVDFVNQWYPAFVNQPMKFGMIRYGPGGISAVDYYNDGFYDLFVPDGVRSRLFRNTGDGTFEDVTTKAGLDGLDGVSVGVFADYDNDGFKDLFVSRTFKHNQLFHNNGDGTFTDVTAHSGIGEDCCTTVASWGDYDNDGYEDLLLYKYGRPELFHNAGGTRFDRVTDSANLPAWVNANSAIWLD